MYCWDALTARAYSCCSSSLPPSVSPSHPLHLTLSPSFPLFLSKPLFLAPARPTGQLHPAVEVLCELLPEGKVAAIAALKAAHGVTCMVGDGINDAPALAAADVSIAMGTIASASAMEAADVALMSDDLRQLARTFLLGRAVRWVVVQNVVASVVVKAVVLGLAVAGRAHLWLAVLADVGTSLAVVGNSLRLLRKGTVDGT
ncbi:unnamed protein product [Closterium sp. Naga37s-1]|nr:unnamed protein product [Closterium sp. Naga37s-1]